MGKIRKFNVDGELEDVLDINRSGFYRCAGMKVRIHMKSGYDVEGFIGNEFYLLDEGGDVYIDIYNFKHLNEFTHKLEGEDKSKYDVNVIYIYIQDIESIDAISYTNPRWGGLLTNHFVLPYNKAALAEI